TKSKSWVCPLMPRVNLSVALVDAEPLDTGLIWLSSPRRKIWSVSIAAGLPITSKRRPAFPRVVSLDVPHLNSLVPIPVTLLPPVWEIHTADKLSRDTGAACAPLNPSSATAAATTTRLITKSFLRNDSCSRYGYGRPNGPDGLSTHPVVKRGIIHIVPKGLR